MPRAKRARETVDPDILFITRGSLRRKIEDCIEAMSVLYILGVRGESMTPEKENWRLIILYAASIMEALLLYLYKEGGYLTEKNRAEYTVVKKLPTEYQFETDSLDIAIAKREMKVRGDKELMLDFLVNYFADNKDLIKRGLKRRILSVKNVRNTFHLYKSRQGTVCTKRSAREAINTMFTTMVLVQRQFP